LLKDIFITFLFFVSFGFNQINIKAPEG